MLTTFIKPPKRLKLLHTCHQFIQTYSTEQSSLISTLNNPVQAYISRSRDPYLNLSIEHYLFQNAPPGSKVLFIYTNRPCVVIGRNQNPWLEANLGLLKHPNRVLHNSNGAASSGVIDLVRRRSGGGAVFHDEGNVNWSVIVDGHDFTRDMHAEMVVRALRKLGVYRARVNERHDIVLDMGKASEKLEDLRDTHSTPYLDDGNVRSLKVSGSAFRISRGRALHHGTALVGSKNMESIGRVLRSPARGFIKAKGVQSVKSDVGNIGIANEAFEGCVLEEFEKLYQGKSYGMMLAALGSEMFGEESVKKGVEELKSLDWLYCQTPAFSITFQTQSDVAKNAPVRLDVRHGVIENIYLDYSSAGERDVQHPEGDMSVGRKLHEIGGPGDWRRLLAENWPVVEMSALPGSLSENVKAWNEFGELEKPDKFLGRIFDH